MTNAVQFTTPPNPTVSSAAGPAPVVEPVRKDEAATRKEDASRTAPSAGGQLADLRLVIEEDKNGSGFIYKTLDRRTGEIIQVYPRDEVLKMSDSAEYHPGTVVDQRT